LHIECRADPAGKTFLSQQSFRAPVHLSKPYWDGNHLVINVVNPTAGLFAGDHIEMTVRVCAGARAVLTSPSAARVFRAKESQPSTQVAQNFVVEGGGRLDVFPELLIPHGGARYAQTTRIEVHAGGQLFFTEMIAPGRTPEPIVARIRREVVEAIGTSAIRDKLAAQLMEPVGNTPEEFRARIEAEISRWEPVIKAADIKVN
jgi:urease accessory protein UreH